MKLVTFTADGSTRLGAQVDDKIVDFSAVDPEMPSDMLTFLQAGDAAMERARKIVSTHAGTISLRDVKLESPIPNPPRIFAVGLNFMDHWDEIPQSVKDQGMKLPEKPKIFNKQSTSATGPYDDIFLPPESIKLDYEAELGVVIGKTCRRVAREDVDKVIAGFTCLNDVTLRDWQYHTPTWTMGKSWDSHCPMGPVMVTPDEIADKQNLQVRLEVDGVEKQNFNTADMIFDIAEQIAYLSTAFTLLPGDVIASGTSAGVAVVRPGPPWLKVGQKVRMEIEGIGAIENTVAADAGESFIR